jgi:hypothetical protein
LESNISYKKNFFKTKNETKSKKERSKYFDQSSDEKEVIISSPEKVGSPKFFIIYYII